MENIFDSEIINDFAQEDFDKMVLKIQSGKMKHSFSSMNAFFKSPYQFVLYKLNENRTTDAMLLGQVTHNLIWEPGTYKDKFIDGPTEPGNTKAGKEQWYKFWDLAIEAYQKTEKENPNEGVIQFETFSRKATSQNLTLGIGAYPKKLDDIKTAYKIFCKKTIITAAIKEDAVFRASRVVNNRSARKLLEGITETEKKVEWRYEGLDYVGYVDGLGPSLFTDLKMVPNSNRNEMIWHIKKSEIPIQAWCYQNAIGQKPFYVLSADKIGEVCVSLVPQNMIDEAGAKMKIIATAFKHCLNQSFMRPDIWLESQDFWLDDSKEPGVNMLW